MNEATSNSKAFAQRRNLSTKWKGFLLSGRFLQVIYPMYSVVAQYRKYAKKLIPFSIKKKKTPKQPDGQQVHENMFFITLQGGKCKSKPQ